MLRFLLPLLLPWGYSSSAAFAPTSRRPALLAFAPREVRRDAGDRRRSSRRHMGKGDGKRRRKKKTTSAAAAGPAPAASPAPLRVSNDINIPIKRQIRWAKLNQEYAKSGGTAFRQTNVRKRTSYRRRLDEEEQEQVMVDRRRRNSEVNWDVVLASHNGTSAPLAMVDGYNVIYQWPRLKKHMLKGNTHRARELLVRDLEELVYIKGWRIECVFDGFGRKTSHFDGPGKARVSAEDRAFRAQDEGRGVRIVYSGVGASADSYIEGRCNDAKAVTEGKLAKAGGSLIVVSNDNMIRMTATGAGALCMSSDRLVDELRTVRKITAYRVEAALTMANRESARPGGTGENRIHTGGDDAEAPDGTRRNRIQIGGDEVEVREEGRKLVVNTLRGGQFVIEDKRKKKPRGNLADDSEAAPDVFSW